MEKGYRVRIAYEGTLEDGAVFGFAKQDQPLEFIIGDGLVLDALEQAIMEMTEIGEKRTITLLPTQAYGIYIDGNTAKIPVSMVPPSQRRIGTQAYLDTEEGPVLGKLLKIKGDDAIYDLNHPLAGKTLTYNL